MSVNGTVGPLVAQALTAEHAPRVWTTDPVAPLVGEPEALRRRREAIALAARLEHERAAAKAGGAEAAKW